MTSSTSNRGTVSSDPADPWWRGAVGYEIYVRSFADSNGDGLGDLAGITSRLDYLSWLGVDAVWLTPFYPSPGHDHGYDVSDYCAVSPRHGTLQDFDVLVSEAHRRDLRVIVDIVPNHTSIEHQWFTRARRHPDGPDRDRYLWADPAPDGGPPNNWRSHFGGPAWTLDEASGQYWCHLFLPEQPDLNWRNPAVRDDFDSILRWWMDRGVDGFRVDVAHGLIKDAQRRDNPQIAPIVENMDPFDAFDAFEHRYDMDQSENVDIFRRWNQICAPRQVMLLGEVNAPRPGRMSRYVAPGALDQAFFLRAAHTDWVPEALLAMVRAMHDAAPHGISWVLSNHDRSRPASRFGGGEAGVRRSLAVSVLLMAMGGTPFLYQGEELGLCDGALRTGPHDPVSVRELGCHPRPRRVPHAHALGQHHLQRLLHERSVDRRGASPTGADGRRAAGRSDATVAPLSQPAGHAPAASRSVAGAARVDRDAQPAGGRAATRLDRGGRQPGRPPHQRPPGLPRMAARLRQPARQPSGQPGPRCQYLSPPSQPSCW